MKSLNHKKIEKKWREYWDANNINQTDINTDKEKFYCLDMFPYPSGSGLHVGHWRGYVLSDVISRYQKLQGKEVLHPMGFDAFGLPAENAAIKEGKHPKINTQDAIATFTRQLNEIGAMYDWTKTINTSNCEYYKWTQWLFGLLYKNGLAYRKEGQVNWCPSCQTVLANEQVIEGTCERCGTEVIKKFLPQWYFKITDYAKRLLDEIDNLDWSDTIKILQKNWIGQSYGTQFEFKIKNSNKKIEVFTTRIDTIYGATFLAIAPESTILDNIITDPEKKVELENYRNIVAKVTDIERQNAVHEKTGFDSGIKVINPFTNEEIPLFVADYIVMDYGTGAVMCVPAHDQRDFDFATKFNIKIKTVIAPSKNDESFCIKDEAFEEKGWLINSGKFSGLDSISALKQMTLSKTGNIKKTVQYKMRDWLVSRQRYWGAPIPIIYCSKCGEVLVEEKDLPVMLPDLVDFKPKGISPLASSEEFINTTCPKCNGRATRETDTLDTFVDSAWYYLRYMEPHNNEKIFNSKNANKWLPVDQYIGGAEHATKHLLYARFITKVLADQGYISFNEPFKKVFGIGLIYYHGAKMSKSKGNVVNPDDLVEYYGTDALRGYELFIGPNDQNAEWGIDGINGIYRFLLKIYKIMNEQFAENDSPVLKNPLNTFYIEYSKSIKEYKTNVAIAQAMKLFNQIKSNQLTKKQASNLLIMLSPFFPFICEELWENIGNQPSIFNARWPEVNLENSQTKKIPVQINGKVKFVIETKNYDNIKLLENECIAEIKQRNLADIKNIKKSIVIPSKIVNFLI